MGSTGCSDNLPRKKPQFFKIILENTMQQKKLEIPRKFVKQYGHDLLDCVILEIPDGAQWQVKLNKTQDGKVWMQYGWLDFAKHYSLNCGNFLVFNPQEVSKFLVVIFDMTGTEISYPPIPTEPEIIKGNFDGLTVLRENHDLQDVREVSPLPSRRPHKRKRGNESNTFRSGPGAGTQCDKLRLKKTKRDAGLRSSQEFNGGYTSRIQRFQSKDGWKKKYYTPTEKAKMLERTQNFHSKNPYFKVVIQPSAVCGSYRLFIPSKFAKKYLSQRREDVILKDSEGRPWSVRYNCDVNKGYTQANFAVGWREFSADRKLVVGDICMFEMIKGRVTTFKVVIFRARKSKSSIPRHQPQEGENGRPSSSKLNAKLLLQAREFKSTKPYFKVIINSSAAYTTKSAYLNIPIEFAKKYLTAEKGDVIIRDKNRRTWSVTYYFYATRGNSQARFGRGWKQFARDNSLKVGDACVFVRNKCRIITLEVIIYHKDETRNFFSRQGNITSLEDEKNGGGDISIRRSSRIFQLNQNNQQSLIVRPTNL